MSKASEISARLLSTRYPAVREQIYQDAEQEFGKNFADHLRDTVEAHHLILNNERGIRSSYPQDKK